MNFTQAIKSGLSKYVDFSSRASRSEYWFYTLFVILVSIVTGIVDNIVLSGMPITNLITSLALLLPCIAVTVRRLHDTDRSGWWILLSFIPLVGAIVLIVWFCTRGTIGQNRFGADPLPAQPSLTQAQSAV
ncbi:DUF805 domain-containing protein [Microvirga sp. 2YAF29]|uniref:DUF805 domain-containing protein n=1 Tax=Microvirga sp. 2YAF29 TaxID=3233031 RepID=UPI003F98E8B7